MKRQNELEISCCTYLSNFPSLSIPNLSSRRNDKVANRSRLIGGNQLYPIALFLKVSSQCTSFCMEHRPWNMHNMFLHFLCVAGVRLHMLQTVYPILLSMCLSYRLPLFKPRLLLGVIYLVFNMQKCNMDDKQGV